MGPTALPSGTGTVVPLDRVIGFSVEPGAQLVVRGLVHTSVDGSSFDAAAQWVGPPMQGREGGLFDWAAGGLQVLERNPDRHEYVLAAVQAPGRGCLAVAAPSPCLVPRLAALAHERLRTESELAATLSGSIELQVRDAVPGPPTSVGLGNWLAVVACVISTALAAGVALVVARRRAATAMGRIRAAARDALRAAQGDETLDRVRSQVHLLVERATRLDGARHRCQRRLRKVDQDALERRREACAASTTPEAAEALEWLEAERAEVAQLQDDLTASEVGLTRVESALRVVSLVARADRGATARAARADPVDGLATELELREDGLAEAERLP